MSANEYRARAEALVGSADRSVSYDMIQELDAVAAEWRKLADLADLQDALQVALQAALGTR